MKKDMKYEMKVSISNPDSGKTEYMDLTAEFIKRENTYGNGYYLAIENESRSFSVLYDIRYDTNFRSANMVGYLTQWANNFWNGKDGAYKLDELIINKLN